MASNKGVFPEQQRQPIHHHVIPQYHPMSFRHQPHQLYIPPHTPTSPHLQKQQVRKDFKYHFDGNIRRWTFNGMKNPTMVEFLQGIRTILVGDHEEKVNTGYRIQYEDEDKDKIDVSTEMEWQQYLSNLPVGHTPKLFISSCEGKGLSLPPPSTSSSPPIRVNKEQNEKGNEKEKEGEVAKREGEEERASEGKDERMELTEKGSKEEEKDVIFLSNDNNDNIPNSFKGRVLIPTTPPVTDESATTAMGTAYVYPFPIPKKTPSIPPPQAFANPPTSACARPVSFLPPRGPSSMPMKIDIPLPLHIAHTGSPPFKAAEQNASVILEVSEQEKTKKSGEKRKRGKRLESKITLEKLIKAGYLAPEQEISYKGERGTLLPDGRIEYKGTIYTAPSQWTTSLFRAVPGNSQKSVINGWDKIICYPEKTALSKLRDKYLAEQNGELTASCIKVKEERVKRPKVMKKQEGDAEKEVVEEEEENVGEEEEGEECKNTSSEAEELQKEDSSRGKSARRRSYVSFHPDFEREEKKEEKEERERERLELSRRKVEEEKKVESEKEAEAKAEMEKQESSGSESDSDREVEMETEKEETKEIVEKETPLERMEIEQKSNGDKTETPVVVEEKKTVEPSASVEPSVELSVEKEKEKEKATDSEGGSC